VIRERSVRIVREKKLQFRFGGENEQQAEGEQQDRNVGRG